MFFTGMFIKSALSTYQETITALNTKVVQLETRLSESEQITKKALEFTAVNAVFIMQEKTPTGYSVVYSKLKDKYSTSTGVLQGIDNLMNY
jgi:hypothetical protein